MHDEGGVEKKVGILNFISINNEVVWHEWVPVVEVGELQSDAVAVLQTPIKKQRGIKLHLKQVTTQVLHVLFDYDVNCLA